MEYHNTLPTGATLRGKSYTYRIERVLGQGTFGITYLATTRVKVNGPLGVIYTNAQVAVKEFFMRDFNERDGDSVTGGNSMGTYSNYKRKFVREADSLSRMDNPHIIKVLESFEGNNTAYYAMEFCEGGTLDDLICRYGGLGETDAMLYFEQIATALHYMHQRKMLHLDLKPGNIMLRSEGEAVLIDFGLSKQYTADGLPETSTMIGLGTPGYAPIEQAKHRDDSKQFAATLDVYALGATLFKMLTGERPPEASDIVNDGFPVEMLQSRGVSERLIRCVTKAMALRSQRYPSVREMAADAGIALVDIPLSATDHHRHETMADEATIIEFPIDSVEDATELPNVHNGHEWVDLGLSVKWATCNVGASSPSDWGNYYAWGETTTKTEYNYGKCATWQKNFGDISGDSRYDAARKNWGGSWRMPTKAECQELVDNCTWTWTTQGGQTGYKVTGKNGNSIFLPAAGSRRGSSLFSLGEYGSCWSSTPNESDTEFACSLGFYSSSRRVGWGHRYRCLTVRPVCD
ncbi:MAG: protein kinase [Bacteroidaceae bacterium]|nr:protein kinase [Bacteroidaceae bacterium]